MNKTQFIKSFISFVIMFTLFSNSATAQHPEKKPVDNEFKQKKELVTFLPYSDLKNLLEKNKKLIYMSYEDFKKLIESKSKFSPPAPINFVIKDLSLIGTINGDHVSFEAIYQIEILNKEWVSIPLISTNTGIKSAIWDNKAAPVSSDSSNYNILSDSVGAHVLKIKFDVKIEEVGNTKKFAFTLPNLPITRLTIKVPEAGIRLNVANSSGLRTEFKKNQTITYVNLNSSGNVSVDWKSNQIKNIQTPVKQVNKVQDNRPSKVITEVQTLISIDEGIMQGVSTFNNQIYHKALDKITIDIPDDLEILSVDSPTNIVQKGLPNISDPNGSKPGKCLTVYFISKIKDNATFNVSYQKTFQNKKAQLSIPDLQLTGKEINKVIGFIAIQSFGNLEVKQLKIANISQLDPKDLPNVLESSAERPILLAYGYIKKKYDLNLEVIPHNDASVEIAMIDAASVDSRLSADGILTSKADYTVRNMSEQYFKFKLPKDAEILAASIDSTNIQVEQIDDNADKKSEYQINIKNYQNDTPFNITIMFKQDFKFNFLNKIVGFYNLNVPEVLNIKTLTISYNLWLPESMHYWVNTALNEGNRSYGSYISYNTETAYKYDSGADQNINAQISNIANSPIPQIDNDKKAGIIPPEYNLPPTTGLKLHEFSDYLLNKDNSNIFIISITKITFFMVFILMFYIAWKLSEKVYKVVTTEQSAMKRAQYAIPVAIILYIASMLFGWGAIMVPLIVSALIYTLYRYKLTDACIHRLSCLINNRMA